MKKIIFIFIIISLLVFPNTKNILVINSYSRDSKWTESQIRGLESSIFNKDYTVYYEYLDISNPNSKKFIGEYANLLKTKYENIDINLIVSTDDSAYNFVINNKKIFNEKVYLIAGGITKKDDEPNRSYLLKSFNLDKNIELIKKQVNENIENIYFVGDSSYEFEGLKEQIMKEINEYPNINFIWLNSDYPESKTQIKNIKNSSAIVHLVYTENYEKIIKDLYADTSIPIYTLYDFYLFPESNILGGYLIDGEALGKELGNMINEFFSSRSVSNKVNNESYSEYKFSLDVAKKLNIKYIPVKSELFSKQIGYIQSRKYEIIFIFVIIIISSITIYHNYKSYKAKKQILEQNNKILELDRELFKTQKEVIASLGQIIENRSKETANHTIRVAKISRLLGELLGFDKEEALSIEIASPLHDVGKIAIPDNILDKPEKLTTEEYEIIKTHAKTGYSILKESEIPILRIAANIAHEHHERWDGKGYPRGIEKEKISIYARITAVADVFDALLSKRSYKNPWTMEEVIEYFKKEKGHSFDPVIVDTFLNNISKVKEIRESFKD